MIPVTREAIESDNSDTLSFKLYHYIMISLVGSGIPEMKTILRGITLTDYLSFRTFISKSVSPWIVSSLAKFANLGLNKSWPEIAPAGSLLSLNNTPE